MTTHTAGKTALALAVAIVSLGVAFSAIAKLPHSEANFLQKASAGGMAEVQMAQLAREKAMRDEVKQFADRIIADHTKANDEITALGTSNGVKLPGGPTKKQTRELDKLRGLSGPDFDREYMKHMVKDHKEDLEDFRKVAKKHKPDDVSEFAKRTVPVLEEHLRMAQVTYDITAAGKRTGERETGSKKP